MVVVHLGLKERKENNLPVYSVGDSAFQASMIKENVPWNREKRVWCLAGAVNMMHVVHEVFYAVKDLDKYKDIP